METASPQTQWVNKMIEDKYYDRVINQRNSKLKKDIMDILQRHRGKENGIKVPDLCNELGFYSEKFDRNVRDHVNLLRNEDGELIGSGVTGYYLCETIDEVVDYLKKKFVKPMLNMGKTIRKQTSKAQLHMGTIPNWLWQFAQETNKLDFAAAKEKEEKQARLF